MRGRRSPPRPYPEARRSRKRNAMELARWTPILLRTHGFHWIDAGGPPRGEVVGEGRSHQQPRRDSHIGKGIGGAYLEEQRFHEAGEKQCRAQAAGGADARHDEALADE